MNYLSKVQVILPKKTKTTDTHNISTIDIILFYLDLFKNKILGTTLEIHVLTFSMILLMPQDMLCRIDSSLMFIMKFFNIWCVQSVKQIFRFTNNNIEYKLQEMQISFSKNHD